MPKLIFLNISILHIIYIHLYVYIYIYIYTALQIKAGQQSITDNLWPLTGHIYNVMIIVTGSFSTKSFFYFQKQLYGDIL